MKKIFIALLCVAMLVVSLPTLAFAETEEYTGEFRKITTNGIWEVNSIKPKSADETSTLLSLLARECIDTGNYATYVLWDENFAPDKATIEVRSAKGTETASGPVYDYSETHEVTVKYNEPNVDLVKKIQTINRKIKFWPGSDDANVPENSYILEDLNLINFYRTAKEPIVSATDTPGDSINAPLNFISEMRNATNGGNVYIKMDPRAGGMGGAENGQIQQMLMGPAVIYHNGIPCVVLDGQVSMLIRNAIYVPEDAEDYMEAAKSRIEKYLGEGAVTITLGGSLDSLHTGDGVIIVDDDFDPGGAHDREKIADNNYYKLTIQNREYFFVLYKVPEKDIKEPTYFGSDIESGVVVTSEDSSIPLDASVFAEEVQNAKIAKAVGTENYLAYDITMNSIGSGKSITKLDNGKFKVKIPMRSEFAGKTLTAYYIDENGNKTAHEVTVEDGYATFETEHFSTYAIVASTAANVPKTSDINSLVQWAGVALIGLGGIIVLYRVRLKKVKN